MPSVDQNCTLPQVTLADVLVLLNIETLDGVVDCFKTGGGLGYDKCPRFVQWRALRLGSALFVSVSVVTS